ncbi:aminotransferase class I/II-fold pyridoxal phosphate-dependent enzyme [Cohnella sp. CFH 77786]|uniref:aminotransferase class I/II-fold pyridoxal phosphate-dependent enzyme n=1 Tax=Cohnella sp. CFH 77786 TaxID=2662265 RepID=UPI001C60D893|nr:PLP-dependent aminotransferase family protein [Cohnella sp. CFH 77786]
MNKIINWMGGWPKDGLVSAADWEERLAHAAERFRQQGISGSAGPEESDDLKTVLARGLLRGKAEGRIGRLKLTPGADAALSLLAERSWRPGDVVLVERLTSRSALQTFRKAGLRVEAVQGDGAGVDPDALKKAISRHRPRVLYAAPACTDPEGAVWPEDLVRSVTAVCRETGVLMLRDDRHEMLAYHGDAGEAGIRLASVPEGVLSIGQLPPGLVAELRFGWLAGEEETLKRWYPAARGGEEVPAEPGVTPLERQALADLIRDQPLEPLVDMLRVQCGERMRRVTALLGQQRMRGLGWRNPDGGIHLWLKLPEGLDGEALLRGAWIRGLMFQPGAPFYAAQPEGNTLRLTFAFSDERQLKTGVSRLLEAIGDFVGRSTDFG